MLVNLPAPHSWQYSSDKLISYPNGEWNDFTILELSRILGSTPFRESGSFPSQKKVLGSFNPTLVLTVGKLRSRREQQRGGHKCRTEILAFCLPEESLIPLGGENVGPFRVSGNSF